MNFRQKLSLVLGLGSGLSLSYLASGQCNSTCSDEAQAAPRGKFVEASFSKPADIVDTAIGAGEFKTLVAAVQAAGLVDTLKSAGPFTVFAPTDAAFAKLPKGTLEDLLRPENKARLAAILTYHVVPSKLMASDVVKAAGAITVNGQRAAIKVKGSDVMIDAARVTATDIACSNGVIHVIDTVILPSTDNIVDTAQSAGTFSTLLTAAKAAGIAPVLAGEGPLTVFAPTDDAFAKLPAGTIENLLKPENKDRLANVLKYHVVSGRIYSEQVVAGKSLSTLLGQSVSISTNGGAVMIGPAKIVKTDINTSNGVIHVIDTVLLPK